MKSSDKQALHGEVFDERSEISVEDLCKLCGIDADTVTALFAEGILEPANGPAKVTARTRLHYRCVRVTSTVMRLQRDLGVNLAGAALAVELLDQIETLRAELHRH